MRTPPRRPGRAYATFEEGARAQAEAEQKIREKRDREEAALERAKEVSDDILRRIDEKK